MSARTAERFVWILPALFLILFGPSTALAQDASPVVQAPATVTKPQGCVVDFTVSVLPVPGTTITSLTASPLPSGATFTVNATNTSGTFHWTPSLAQSGSYFVAFQAVDNTGASSVSNTSITITQSARGPVVTAPFSQSVNEGSCLTFTVSAVDPDGDPINCFTPSPIPFGASFTTSLNRTSGTFTWCPGPGTAGTYTVTFTACSDVCGGPVLCNICGSATVMITVLAAADHPPVVTVPASVNGAENSLTTFTVTASDPDGDPISSLTASGPAITAGATFTSNAAHTGGTFSWTPSFTQSGTYNATFTAVNALSGSATTQLTIQNTDRQPIVTAPATVSGAEGNPLTFTVTASDPDGDAITSLTSSALPAGATFSVNGAFTSGTFAWTPSAGQAGNYTVGFTARNALQGFASVAIGIATTSGDRAPVVTAPATQSTPENVLLAFVATASDPDGDPITTFTATGTAITGGAIFTTNATNTSGTFSWTPNFTQAGYYSVTFTASNALSGSATTSILVGGPDRAPVVIAPATQSVPSNVLLTFTVSAADPDGDAITALTAAPLPSGATFTSNAAHTSGTFSWTPNNAQMGNYNVVFTASNALSGSATTTITAGISDRPPVVTAPATASGTPNTLITFVVLASDPDAEAITSLTATGPAITAGGTFTTNGTNTSGTFAWTPTSSQGGTYNVTFTASNALSGSATTAVTAYVTDRAPTVTAPATATFPLTVLSSFTVSASDPDGDAISSLTASGTAVTAGGTFTSNATHTSGTFSWTPSFTQGGAYSATFTAANALMGSATTSIYAGSFDYAPVVTAPATVSGSEGTLITFTVTASDANGDAIVSLTAIGLPPGATFSTNAAHTSGTFNWTPTLSQSGSYTITFFASNALSGSATTTITVQDVCLPAVADAGGPYVGVLNAPITFDGSASTGTSLTYLWDFGDGTTGSGVNPTHTYSVSGTYTVTLTAQAACGAPSTDATTVTLSQFCAVAFTSGGNKSIRLDSGKQIWCAQVEPVNSCYSNSDVDLTSIVMLFTGGAVSEIHASMDKAAVGGDKNNDGIDEITACFTKADLRQLFSALPSGENTVTVTIRMNLVSGGQVFAQLTVRVFSSGPALAAQVTPNPFNPSAVLSFRTSRDGFARAALYDASGRRVRTLLNDRSLASGYHEVRLDGRGDSGAGLASGIYLYRLDTAEGSASGRVVLMK